MNTVPGSGLRNVAKRRAAAPADCVCAAGASLLPTFVLLALLLMGGCAAPAATPTAVPSPTIADTPTPTDTPTATRTATPTATSSVTPSPSPTPTALPTATATATQTPTPQVLSGATIVGRNFSILNRHSTLQVAIDEAWGVAEVERLVDRFKPGWQVQVRIVGSLNDLPLRPDKRSGGYQTYTKGNLFNAEMASYDAALKVAIFYYYPNGDHFVKVGGRPVEAGADQVGDFSFSFRFVTFLAMDSPAYLAPGGPDIPAEAAAERDAHCGAPRFAGGKGAALFTWGLPVTAP